VGGAAVVVLAMMVGVVCAALADGVVSAGDGWLVLMIGFYG
jgi:hypothetical protein